MFDTAPQPHHPPSRVGWRPPWALPVQPAPAPAALPWDRDAAFVALQQGYRASGGLLRSDAWTAAAGTDGRPLYIGVARQLVAGQLFSFRWHDSIWLPRFQFSPDGRALRDAPLQVLAELGGVFDGWDLAGWYVADNGGLGDRRPIDLLDSDLPAVLATARADRFAVDG